MSGIRKLFVASRVSESPNYLPTPEHPFDLVRSHLAVGFGSSDSEQQAHTLQLPAGMDRAASSASLRVSLLRLAGRA